MNQHQSLILSIFFVFIFLVACISDVQAQRRRSLEVESEEVDLDLNYIDYSLNIQDKMNEEPLLAQLNIVNDLQQPLLEQLISQDENKFLLQLERGRAYNLIISAENYEDTTFVIDVNEIGEFYMESEVKLSPILIEYKIDVSDIETDDPLSGVNIIATNNKRDEKLVFRKGNEEGSYIVDLRASDTYEIEITDDGYFFASKLVDPSAGEIEKNTKVKLTQLKPGSKIRLNNITFAKGSYELNQTAIKELNRVAKILQDTPSLVLEVAAHTDDKGTHEENMTLAEDRSTTVYNFLLKFEGIDGSRLIPKAYGELQPIVPNDSEENRAINRRFELIVISM